MEESAWENNHRWDVWHTRWLNSLQTHELCGARLWTNGTAQMCLVIGFPVHTSPSIFWNSFQDTEITTIIQMMWNTMSSKSFGIVNFATAMLKLKTLPTVSPWLPVVPPSSFSIDKVIAVFSSFGLLIFSLTLLMFWTYRSQRLPRFHQVSVLHFKALASCIVLHATANSGRCRRDFFLRPISIQTKNPMFGGLQQPLSFRCCVVVSFKSDAIEIHGFLLANIVLHQ